jgi:hypothetical protein
VQQEFIKQKEMMKRKGYSSRNEQVLPFQGEPMEEGANEEMAEMEKFKQEIISKKNEVK